MPYDTTHLQAADPNDKGLIDLDTYTNDNFTLLGYKLCKLFDDIILIKYSDLADETGDTVMRNGIAIPLAHVEKAWRIGQVVLAGPKCEHVTVDDYVCFPSDRGIPCSNLDVEGIGVLKDAIFLNEQRIFGICKKVDLNKTNENNPVSTKRNSTGKRRGDKIRKKTT